MSSGSLEELNKATNNLMPMYIGEPGYVLEDKLLKAVAADACNGVVLLAYAKRQKIQESVEHVF